MPPLQQMLKLAVTFGAYWWELVYTHSVRIEMANESGERGNSEVNNLTIVLSITM